MSRRDDLMSHLNIIIQYNMSKILPFLLKYKTKPDKAIHILLNFRNILFLMALKLHSEVHFWKTDPENFA